MKTSAGILLYRRNNSEPEFFLVHPGGPFWVRRDEGVWSIPKGEYENEDPFSAAKREFKEETGFDLPQGEFLKLAPIVQRGGKEICAWAVEGDADPEKLKSNPVRIWGKEFSEVDRGGWFGLEKARKKINSAQVAFIEELLVSLK